MRLILGFILHCCHFTIIRLLLQQEEVVPAVLEEVVESTILRWGCINVEDQVDLMEVKVEILWVWIMLMIFLAMKLNLGIYMEILLIQFSKVQEVVVNLLSLILTIVLEVESFILRQFSKLCCSIVSLNPMERAISNLIEIQVVDLEGQYKFTLHW